MITTYAVVCEENTKILSQKMNDFLRQGWECQGGLLIDDENNFYQAMIKKEKPKHKKRKTEDYKP